MIEDRLDALQRRVPDRWWVPYAVAAGALGAGVLLSQPSLLRIMAAGARTVRTALVVASALAAVDRYLAERRASRAA
jgi:hypothetical protein